LIEEKEWFTIVGAIFHANRFALYTGTNRDVSTTLSPERSTLEIRFAVQVCPLVSERGEGGGFSEEVVRSPGVQGPIVDARRRVGGDFCSCHDEES